MASDALPLARREILLLEDDPALRRRLVATLRALGGEVSEATNLAEARRLLRDLSFDFALVDLHLPDGDALMLLREGVFSENTGVVVMTAFGGIPQAVEAMRLGAGDYLTKPFEPEALPVAFLRCRQQRTAARRTEHQNATGTDGAELFFGHSLDAVRRQLDTILAAERRLERRLPPVLIEGETGTGKTALARWLHRHGPRAAEPFIAVNCAALPEQLAESELFGHERGAFTDARTARTGLFEAADGGTLFLDEIASLSPAIQAKVLVAIEDGRIRRLGSNKEIAIDARLIAASNRPLRALAETGGFRDDLYQRLDLLHVTLPPLRERGADIVALARQLLAATAKRHRLRALTISDDGARRLQAQRWSGNVRELAHEIERAVIFGQTGAPLDFAHLPAAPSSAGVSPASGSSASSADAQPLHDWRNPAWRLPESGFSLDAITTALIDDALRETGGNVSAAARRLGVTRQFLRYRLEGGTGEASDAASREAKL
ncbi:MAG: sigma-54-dependent Fis family transcriptional regulator [Opitutae bacterium]|nr:sigma-54-dependent Fis family transcriptional regulator [Opitutae bacterium]